MIRNMLSASLSLAFATFSVIALSSAMIMAPNALAQDSEETAKDQAVQEESAAQPTFKLLRDDETAASDLAADEVADAWTPKLEKGTLDVSLSIGFLNLNTTLLQYDQIIYKYTTESTFWGDVELKGQSAFAPTIRIGYNITGWLAVEGWTGMSVSEYTSNVENRRSRKNEPGAPIVENPPLGEFDAEKRSLITLQAGANLTIYPLDIIGDREGRLHPFITGGAGSMWYSANSNYVKDMASAVDVNLGLGLLFLADSNVSVRLEAVAHRNELDWTPADYFMELNEGTTQVPLDEFPELPNGSIDQKPVTEFESNIVNALYLSIGLQVSF